MVLVEATANQVNQNGGYTGMTPVAFRAFLNRLAEEENFPIDKLLCGGDHLGPLTWTHLPEAEAMKNAGELIRSYYWLAFPKYILIPACAWRTTLPTSGYRML